MEFFNGEFVMIRKLSLFGVVLLLCCSSAFASVEDLTFLKVKRNKSIVLRNCELFEEVKSVAISDGGRTVALSKNMERNGVRLKKKYLYFACGFNEVGEVKIFAKKRESQAPVELKLPLKGFKKRGKYSCQGYRSSSDGGMGWLHKPVSDSTGSIVNLFPTSDRPGACRYERSDGSLITDGRNYGRGNGNREHIRPASGGRCSSFPSNTVLNCSISGKRICYRIPNPCQRYD